LRVESFAGQASADGCADLIRYTILILVVLAVPVWAGCGGRPKIPEIVPVEDPGPTDSQTTAEIFEACAPEGLAESLAVLRSLRGTIDPTVAPPAITIATIDLEPACVNFMLDADRNGQDDTAGSICFLDPLGTPGFPFDATQLGAIDFQALLADAPDGSIVNLTLTRSGPLAMTISVRMLTLNGALFDTAGRIDVVTVDGCSSTYLFSGVHPSSLLGAYPNAIVTAMVSGPEGSISGTISLNGTMEAVVSMSLEDGELATYRLNLDTFELEPLETITPDPSEGP